MADTNKYSIDMVKKSCFIDEIMEIESRYPDPSKIELHVRLILEYLKERVKEIDSKYKVR